MSESETHFQTASFKSTSNDGHVFYRRSRVETDPETHIIVLHDFLDHHKHYLEFEKFYDELSDENFSMTWMDLIGHGYSGGGRADIDDFDTYCRDLLKLMSECKLQSKKVLLVGHGLGALVITRLFLEVTFEDKLKDFNIKGAILINPTLKFKKLLVHKLQRLLLKLPLPFLSVRVPYLMQIEDFVSHPRKAKEFLKDPLIPPYITSKLLMETLKIQREVFKQAYFVNFPLLILLSKDDDMVDPEVTKKWALGITEDKTRFFEYSGLHHDLFYGTSTENIFKDISNWLRCIL